MRWPLRPGQDFGPFLVILSRSDFVGLIASQQISQALLLGGRNRQSGAFKGLELKGRSERRFFGFFRCLRRSCDLLLGCTFGLN